jgi:hypothetical protein
MIKFTTIIFTVLLISLGSSNIFAQADATPDVYMIKGKETLDSVAAKLIVKYKSKYNNRIEDFKKDLAEWNPQINSWNPIPVFSNIYVEYPYPAYVSVKYAPKLTKGTNYNVLNSDAETPLGNKKYTLFAMYTASAGDFQEQIKNQEGNIKSTQNSPLSLGIGTTVLLDKTNRMINSSIYWSSLRTSRLSGDSVNASELETKPEIGFNLYYQQLTSWHGLSFYGGADYEQFSTCNTTAFIDGEELALNQNKIFYATAGVARTFFISNYKLLLKSSLSQSLKSDTTSSRPDDKFDGQRFTLFGSVKGESQFTYHLLYKRHMLEGPTKLTINRIGVGIGFVIF